MACDAGIIPLFPPKAWQPLSPELFCNVLQCLDALSFAEFKASCRSVGCHHSFQAAEAALVKEATCGVMVSAPSALGWAGLVQRGTRIAKAWGAAEDVRKKLTAFKKLRVLELVAEEHGCTMTLCTIALSEALRIHAKAWAGLRLMIMQRLEDLAQFAESRVAAAMVSLHSTLAPYLAGQSMTEAASGLRSAAAGLLACMLRLNKPLSLAVVKHEPVMSDVYRLLRSTVYDEGYAAVEILVHLLNMTGDQIAKDLCKELRLAGCVPYLTKLLQAGGESRTSVLMVLDCLSGDAEGAAALRIASALPSLMDAVDVEGTVQDLAMSIHCKLLAFDAESLHEVCRAGGVKKFMTFLNDKEDDDNIALAVDILSIMATVPEMAAEIRVAGGFQRFLNLSKGTHAYVRDAAFTAICVMTKSDPGSVDILRTSGELSHFEKFANGPALPDSGMWLGTIVGDFLQEYNPSAKIMAKLILKMMDASASS